MKVKTRFINIQTGSLVTSRRLPLMLADSEVPGPVVWLTACAHGDEVGGIVVIHEIFDRLKVSPLRRGRLFALPLMNPYGFEVAVRNVTVSNEDLNRTFPGDAQGTPAERLAHLIFSSILGTQPDLIIDMHNDWRRSIPYTILDPLPQEISSEVRDAIHQTARQLGVIVVEEEHISKQHRSLSQSLSASLVQREVAALTVELGESFVVNERNVALGEAAVWNVLEGLNMVAPIAEPLGYQLTAEQIDAQFQYCDKPLASSSGIARFLVKPAQEVRAGQPVVRIYNAFGKLHETVRAPGDGFVLGCSDVSVVYPGQTLVAFALRKSPD